MTVKHTVQLSFSLAICIAISSCTTRVRLENMKIDDGCKYYAATDEGRTPFTGIVYTVFGEQRGEDSNAIAIKYRLENGIPSGNYTTYASRSDIFEKGKYIPVMNIDGLKSYFPSIRRLNVCRTQYLTPEPEFSVYVVTAMPALDSVNFATKRDTVINYLISHNLINRDDVKYIFSVDIVKGEITPD